jgi:two-component system response regulator AtoC
LQGGKFSRIGGDEVKVEVRIIAATNKDLERSVSDGTFREDLYYRLNVVAIYLPPLRERKDDIPLFVELFLKKFNDQFNKQFRRLTRFTIQSLIDYSWPGNVRELENLIKRIVIIGDEELVLKQYMSEENGKTRPSSPAEPAIAGRPLNGDLPEEREVQRGLSFQPLKMIAKEAQKKAEAEVILRALEWTRWNRKEAARLLKISYKALLYKIRQCNLEEQA